MINNKDNINNDNTYLILFIVFLIGFIVFLIGFIYYCQHSNTDKKKLRFTKFTFKHDNCVIKKFI